MSLELVALYAWEPKSIGEVELTALVTPVTGRLRQSTVTFTKGEPAETVAAKLRLLAEAIDKIVENQE